MLAHSPLLTDQYQLVMADAYWQLGMSEKEAVFLLSFRSHPFHGRYTISSGLNRVIDFISHWHFKEDELSYLASLKTADGQTLFKKDFLNYLSQLRFTGDIDAVPEGTLVFPHEPLLRIRAPILQCQLLETALINFINFSSLITTKAARVCEAAQNDAVVEFGLRRAQGPDGGLMASRAAYIGGCTAVSNVLAGKMYGIPVVGTQAHSWIMAFEDELTAFKKFAQVMSHNTILLVDTYNTLEGVQNAILIAKELATQNLSLLGIRLDSGDLVELSQQARLLLDQAGLQNTKILASGDLDEYFIAEMKSKGAKIDIWGVGTRLVTSYDQPAMNTIYKLAAIAEQNHWHYKIKVSNDPGKITTPGIQQIRRYYSQSKFMGDVIYDIDKGINEELPDDSDQSEDLLVPIFRKGQLVYQSPALNDIRHFCQQQIQAFLNSNWQSYPVQLEKGLADLKQSMLENKENKKLD
jgi:nicotinate phosphoribosyltransferase